MGSIDFEGREEIKDGLMVALNGKYKNLKKNLVFDEDGHTVWIIWDRKKEGWHETISNLIASSNNVNGM